MKIAIAIDKFEFKNTTYTSVCGCHLSITSFRNIIASPYEWAFNRLSTVSIILEASTYKIKWIIK